MPAESFSVRYDDIVLTRRRFRFDEAARLRKFKIHPSERTIERRCRVFVESTMVILAMAKHFVPRTFRISVRNNMESTLLLA